MTLLEIKTAIENGAKFNGTVYGKNNGKNWATLSIYLDNKYINLGSVPQKEAAERKAEIAAELNGAPEEVKEETSTWTIGTKNGTKEIRNNLTYGEMYNLYGMDFE